MRIIRKYNIYNGYNIDIINSKEVDLDKKLMYQKIYEGMTLYIEEIILRK